MERASQAFLFFSEVGHTLLAYCWGCPPLAPGAGAENKEKGLIDPLTMQIWTLGWKILPCLTILGHRHRCLDLSDWGCLHFQMALKTPLSS